jgi:hypothetical protein
MKIDYEKLNHKHLCEVKMLKLKCPYKNKCEKATGKTEKIGDLIFYETYECEHERTVYYDENNKIIEIS